MKDIFKIRNLRHSCPLRSRRDCNGGQAQSAIRNGLYFSRNPQSAIRNGFTLMELMVVVAIIVLLAGIMMPNFAKRIERAKMTKAETDIATIESAIAMYETDIGKYPPSGIVNLENWLTGQGVVTNVPAAKNWHGPYIKGIEDDPWYTGYVYMKNGNPRGLASLPGPTAGTDYPNSGDGGSVVAPDNMHYYIYSKGKNRQTGAGFNEDDINNWDVDKTWEEDAY